MQVGDIISINNEIFIISNKRTEILSYDMINQYGEVFNFISPKVYKIIKFNNGSLKEGIAEFMGKYYKGE